MTASSLFGAAGPCQRSVTVIRPPRPPPLHEVIETARIAALDSYAVIGTPHVSPFEALARRAASELLAPIALVGFMDRNRQWLAAGIGLVERDLPRHTTICHRTVTDAPGWLVVADALAESRLSHLPWVQGAPRVRSYAGAALIDRDGYRLGTIAVMHGHPDQFGAGSATLLRRLAAEGIETLALHRAGIGTAPVPAGAQVAESSGIQGWLGVRTELAGASVGDGLRLTSVAQDSPAERAGLRTGDVLLTLGGQPTRRAQDIITALSDRRPGSRAALEYLRDTHRQTGTVPIEPMPLARQSKRRLSERQRG